MRIVFFDMDGVLTDSMPGHIESWTRALGEFGIEPTRAELLRLGGMPFRQTVLHFTQKKGIKISDEKMYELNQKKNEYFNNTKNSIKVFEGVFEIIKYLKSKKVRLFVVTGSQKEIADLLLVNFGLKDFFERIITKDDVKYGKPAPDSYLKALELSKEKAENCMVVEDSPLGIKAARDAGIQVIGIGTSVPKEELSDATYIVENHKELLNFFKKILE